MTHWAKNQLTINPIRLEEILPEILKSLSENDFIKLSQQVEHLADPELTDIIVHLEEPNKIKLIEALNECSQIQKLYKIDLNLLSVIFNKMPPENIAKILNNMRSNKAAELLNELREDLQQQVLAEVDQNKQSDVKRIMDLPKDSAGWWMHQDFIAIPYFWTVAEARDFIVNRKLNQSYNIFLIDVRHHPIAVLPVNKLLNINPQQRLDEHATKLRHWFKINDDQEDIAVLFRRYSLNSAPIVDEHGRLIGVITFDDIIELIHSEAMQDSLNLNRVSNVDFYLPVIPTAIMRVRWLIVTLVNCLIGSSVIAKFDTVIEKTVILASVMPIVAAMGGNAGMQVVSVMVRALATQDLKRGNLLRTLKKEVLVGLINSAVLVILLDITFYILLQNLSVVAILTGALVFNVLWAAFLGVIMTYIVDAAGFDPAISVGPFVTACTDIGGYTVFLSLATMILRS